MYKILKIVSLIIRLLILIVLVYLGAIALAYIIRYFSFSPINSGVLGVIVGLAVILFSILGIKKLNEIYDDWEEDCLYNLERKIDERKQKKEEQTRVANKINAPREVSKINPPSEVSKNKLQIKRKDVLKALLYVAIVLIIIGICFIDFSRYEDKPNAYKTEQQERFEQIEERMDEIESLKRYTPLPTISPIPPDEIEVIFESMPTMSPVP